MRWPAPGIAMAEFEVPKSIAQKADSLAEIALPEAAEGTVMSGEQPDACRGWKE
jgi:hypothetical protein